MEHKINILYIHKQMVLQKKYLFQLKIRVKYCKMLWTVQKIKNNLNHKL